MNYAILGCIMTAIGGAVFGVAITSTMSAWKITQLERRLEVEKEAKRDLIRQVEALTYEHGFEATQNPKVALFRAGK